MLWTITVILLVLWVLGLVSSYTLCVFRSKPTGVPAGSRPAFRFDGDRHSGRMPTAFPELSDRLFVM